MTKTPPASVAEIMDLEEIKKVIRETIEEELQLLRKQIVACVEKVAKDAFARLKASYERGSDEMDPISEVSEPQLLESERTPTPVQQDHASDSQKDSSEPLKSTTSHCLKGPKPRIFDPQFTSLSMYLDKLKNFFSRYQINTDFDQLQVAAYGLANENIKPMEFDTYANFQAAFLAQQPSSETKIFTEFYKSKYGETLVEFSRRMMHQVEKYCPDMPFSQFRSKLVTQLPVKVAAVVIKAAPKTAFGLNQLLTKLDLNPRAKHLNSSRAPRDVNFSNQRSPFRPPMPPQWASQKSYRGGRYVSPYVRAAAQTRKRARISRFTDNLEVCSLTKTACQANEGMGEKAETETATKTAENC